MDTLCPGIPFVWMFVSQVVKKGDRAPHQSLQIYGCVENDDGPAMKTFPAGLWVGAD